MFWILFLSKLSPCLLTLGVGCRFCQGCIVTMKNVERNCFQNSFPPPRRLNFIPCSILLERYGKEYILLCIPKYMNDSSFQNFVRLCSSTPSLVLGAGGKHNILQSRETQLSTYSPMWIVSMRFIVRANIVIVYYTSLYTNALEPLKLPGATAIT